MESATPTAHAALCERLTRIWALQMPITSALGVRLDSLDETAIQIRIPMGPNRNHRGTVFGGSVAALATLAGWSAVWLALVESGVEAHTVIQDSQIRYTHPAHSDVVARAIRPGPDDVERLLAMIARRGRGRVGVTVTIRGEAGQQVAEFDGRYVAQV